MQAIVGDTPAEPKGPWAMPGKYTVRLTVNGQAYERSLSLRMDPRVATSSQDLQMQFDMAKGCWDDSARAASIQTQIGAVRDQIKTARAKATGDEATRLDALDEKLAGLVGQSSGRRRSRFGGGLADDFGGIFGNVEGADVQPTLTMQAGYKALVKQLADLEAAWSEIKAKELTGFTVPPETVGMPVFQQQNGDEDAAEPS
jgi:hypothetical protein